MESQLLRYKFELAIVGMKDGPATYASGSIFGRLQLLLSYKRDWPKLCWTHEFNVKIPTPALVGVCGGFLHQIRSHGPQHVLELAELPSCRTGRPPSLTRHLRYNTTQIESVAIDPLQSLIVTSHVLR